MAIERVARDSRAHPNDKAGRGGRETRELVFDMSCLPCWLGLCIHAFGVCLYHFIYNCKYVRLPYDMFTRGTEQAKYTT